MFFYHQKSFHGGWVPVKAVDRPGKRAEGKAPATTGLVKLEPHEYDDTLTTLAARYPAPSEGDYSAAQEAAE